ncbi:MAG: PrsW family glutamic-type intramembrane protease [Streptosporangiaceae bacterium]
MTELKITYESQQWSFRPGQTARIGRSLDNEVVVSNPAVSRQHARVWFEGGSWVFENIGRAPTFLAGRPVTRLPLSYPAELALAAPQGPVLRVEVMPDRSEPAPAPGAAHPAGAGSPSGLGPPPQTLIAADGPGQPGGGQPGAGQPGPAAPLGAGLAGTGLAGAGSGGKAAPEAASAQPGLPPSADRGQGAEAAADFRASAEPDGGAAGQPGWEPSAPPSREPLGEPGFPSPAGPGAGVAAGPGAGPGALRGSQWTAGPAAEPPDGGTQVLPSADGQPPSYVPPPYPLPPSAAPPSAAPPSGEPQYGEPQYGEPQYGQPPYGQPPYGQHAPGQHAPGQPPYDQPPYQQPPYQQPQQEPARPRGRHGRGLAGAVPAWIPGGTAGRPGAAGDAGRDELVTAFQILVPIKSWLTDPGWRQGLRLLVIPYALLPLIFLALFASSGDLSTPGWAYSLYIAPLWLIAFWLLIRPGPIRVLEIQIGAAIIVWVLIWIKIVTVNINTAVVPHPGRPIPLPAALVVGFNEEITKALPVLLAALAILRFRSAKLDVRMWMFLGTVAGLTFGVSEQAGYTLKDILNISQAQANSQAVVAVLAFAERVFVDGFQHAVWAGVAAFFIGMAVNYPRRRIQLIIFGISVPAVLHALNDWSLGAFSSPWPWIFIQAISLFLFLGYTISAAAIERRVRQTPLFRGESMQMEAISLKRDRDSSGATGADSP